MFKAITLMMERDMLLAVRRPSDVLTTLFFFVIVVTLFPLGVGPEKETLRIIAPGVMWVAALLATMLSLNRLFSDDYVDGSLEQLVITPEPLSLLVLSKVITHWLLTGLPLTILAPVLAMQLGLEGEPLLIMVVTLLLGTPVLSLIGAIGAALTVGVRGGGVLLSLLVLPLYIPVLIFGSGAVEASVSGLGYEAHLSILGAFMVLAAVFAPWATAAALRISLE